MLSDSAMWNVEKAKTIVRQWKKKKKKKKKAAVSRAWGKGCID